MKRVEIDFYETLPHDIQKEYVNDVGPIYNGVELPIFFNLDRLRVTINVAIKNEIT